MLIDELDRDIATIRVEVDKLAKQVKSPKNFLFVCEFYGLLFVESLFISWLSKLGSGYLYSPRAKGLQVLYGCKSLLFISF